jgi:hypothetical protein
LGNTCPEGSVIVNDGYLVTLQGADWRDYLVQVTKYRLFSDDYWLLLRFQDLSNFVAYGRDGCCMIVEVVSGGQMIYRYWVGAPAFHQPETLSASIEGLHFEAYSDGNLMFATELPQDTPMFGRVGLRTPHADPLFDDFSVFALSIPATVTIKPDTLSLTGNGPWITAFIELPDGYDPLDIAVDTVRLEGLIPAQQHFAQVADNDGDDVLDLMVKFSRQILIEYLDGMTGEVTLGVSVNLSDGTPFQGGDTITVINPGKQ